MACTAVAASGGESLTLISVVPDDAFTISITLCCRDCVTPLRVALALTVTVELPVVAPAVVVIVIATGAPAPSASIIAGAGFPLNAQLAPVGNPPVQLSVTNAPNEPCG